MVSIKDVARNAGVSVSTVSHVLNKTRFVAPQTAEKVQKAVNDLSYRPNEAARALKTQRSNTLGMLVSNSTNPFFSDVVRGVEQGCFARTYSLILCNCDDQAERQIFYLNTLAMKRVDALIVMTTHGDPEFDKQLGSEKTLPMVVLDAEAQENVCVIGDNSTLGGRLATEYLIAEGYKNIGVLTGPASHPRSRERYQGYKQTVDKAGLSIRDDWRVEADFSAEGGYKAMLKLLDKQPVNGLPHAIFAFNDLMALGAIRACNERGLRVPDDLAIIGYDDIDLAAYFTPPLTTIYQPGFDLGLQAANILLDNIENGIELPSTLMLNPQLVIRGSV